MELNRLAEAIGSAEAPPVEILDLAYDTRSVSPGQEAARARNGAASGVRPRTPSAVSSRPPTASHCSLWATPRTVTSGIWTPAAASSAGMLPVRVRIQARCPSIAGRRRVTRRMRATSIAVRAAEIAALVSSMYTCASARLP